MRAHIDHQISAALRRHRDSLFAYAATPSLFDHDFSSWSDAYIPLAANNEADRQLDAVLRSARAILRTHSRVTLNKELFAQTCASRAAAPGCCSLWEMSNVRIRRRLPNSAE
jgi:hypothetical protein